MVLSVLMRIQWGSGRFCLCALASVRFVRKVFCDGCGGEKGSFKKRKRWGQLVIVPVAGKCQDVLLSPQEMSAIGIKELHDIRRLSK
jgi:hypothetical protein